MRLRRFGARKIIKFSMLTHVLGGGGPLGHDFVELYLEEQSLVG